MPTVKELKATLRRYGLPVSGRKWVLFNRIAKARAIEFSKRSLRAVRKKRFPELRFGEELNDTIRARVNKLNEEAEAALRASAYDKRVKKNPTIRRTTRRSLRKRQITSILLKEGKRRLAQDLRFLDLDAVVPHPAQLPAGDEWVNLFTQAKEEFDIDGAVRTYSTWYVERDVDDIDD